MTLHMVQSNLAPVNNGFNNVCHYHKPPEMPTFAQPDTRLLEYEEHPEFLHYCTH
jgi:hypothetical protein